MHLFTGISLRRRITATVLGLALIGTGLSSLAVLTDTLVDTNTFAAASIDLQGNALQTVSHTFALGESGVAYDDVWALEVSNAGNVQLRYSAAASATYVPAVANGWDGLNFYVHSVANAGQCVAGIGAGSRISNAGITLDGLPEVFGNAAAGAQAGDRTLNASASEWLCLEVKGTPTFAPAATATQILSFSAESTGL